MKPIQILFNIAAIVTLTGCMAQSVRPSPVSSTPQSVPATSTLAVNAAIDSTQPSSIDSDENQAQIITTLSQENASEGIDVDALPHLWMEIDKEKIEIYPYNHKGAFAYAKDGSLWLAGGFGVIHHFVNGKEIWYSIKNGLPNNQFSELAISPKGEVWIGGMDNALFRFDGQNWIDEGEKLPPPFDDRTNYLCYSKSIEGIEFGPDGSAWIMNSGIEIYRQAFAQWINVPFPKELLPMAGGGGCPLGFRLKTENDISIKIGGC